MCEVSSGIGTAGGMVTYLHADLHVFVALCFKQNLSPGRLTAAYSIGSAIVHKSQVSTIHCEIFV